MELFDRVNELISLKQSLIKDFNGIGVIGVNINDHGSSTVSIFGFKNLIKLANGRKIIIDLFTASIIYKYRAHFTVNKVEYSTLLTDVERAELEALINGHQQNDG